MLGRSLVATAWHILRLQMEGRPPDTEGSCDLIPGLILWHDLSNGRTQYLVLGM